MNDLISLPSPELYQPFGSRTDAEFLQYGFASLLILKKYGGLLNSESILEIGCGIGRTAIPLTTYIKTGVYEGIDLNQQVIEWCQNNITSKFPSFKFSKSQGYHPIYAPDGNRDQPFTCPYSRDSFDFVFLFSLFSELPPYLLQTAFQEIARVLKPGGRVLWTGYIMTNIAKKSMHKRSGIVDSWFAFDNDLNAYTNKGAQGPVLYAYEDTFLIDLANKYGFALKQVVPGNWATKETAGSNEDIIIFNF